MEKEGVNGAVKSEGRRKGKVQEETRVPGGSGRRGCTYTVLEGDDTHRKREREKGKKKLMPKHPFSREMMLNGEK